MDNYEKEDYKWMEYMLSIDNSHRKQDAEFMRLCAEPCSKVPNVGDHVLVACGLIGMGFPWIREEAIVLKCADTAYYVEFQHYNSFTPAKLCKWVHQALITDVL